MGAALEVRELGRVAYGEALALQAELAAARRRGEVPDTLLLLEHAPVVTLGRSTRPENLLVPRGALEARGIAVHEVARGGDVTYHAPGQLVGYPILDLAARGTRDVQAYLRALEQTLGDALEALGVAWHRIPGWTGVFAGAAAEPSQPPAGRAGPRPRKIASIGVGVRSWVTTHGFALNVDLDLAGFAAIIPCGLSEVEMTSLARELAPDPPADLPTRARESVRSAFLRRFE